MPITVPPFNQYQAPLFPLRGLWRVDPKEGDKFVTAEIDWGTTVPFGLGVQFALSGNSPLAITQIVALAVDNSRCGSDVNFIFPDSASEITVPAYGQGTYPVYTNALTFYVVSANATTTDRTILTVHNSLPPPISFQPSGAQEAVAATGIDLSIINVPVQLIIPQLSGTVESFTITAQVNAGDTSAHSALLVLRDGTGAVIYIAALAVGPSLVLSIPISVGPISVRFRNGLQAVVTGSNFLAASSFAAINVYYGLP